MRIAIFAAIACLYMIDGALLAACGLPAMAEIEPHFEDLEDIL